MMLRWPALLAAAALAGCATVPKQDAAPLKLAITVDDLPVHGAAPPGEAPLRVAEEMIAALKSGGASDAVGFVNGQDVEADPATREVLTAWRAAGLPLANHGWAHRHLSEISVAEFEQEVARNEPLLRELSAGDEWRWFRFPFLDEGGSAEKRTAARQVLARRGYKVAAVTMDFSDWQWTAPYARCAGTGDQAAIQRMEDAFLKAARENITYSRARAHRAAGRDIPYVLLLHVSAFSGRMMPRLLELYREAGFRFVPIEEAQSDPFYATQNDPALPLPAAREDAAPEAPLPPRTDFAPMLESICR